jgi:phage shock protein C
MDKTIEIALGGRDERYRLNEDAYDRLSRYLDRAAVRLGDDPDRAEVLGDLERSIGDRLAALLASGDRLVSVGDVDGVLEAIGTVDTGLDPVADERRGRARSRRLHRVREGQQIAGVCTGLAAYSEIDVDWIRTLFILGTLVTAGILGLVYIAMAFILPVAATPRDV